MQKATSQRKAVSFKDKINGLKIRHCIECGVLPMGLTVDQIFKGLRDSHRGPGLEFFGFLSRKHTRAGEILSEGLVSCRLVTTAFAAYIVASLQDSTTYPMDAFSWHAIGTGNTAEANTQTALVTEIEARVDGTQEEGASIYIFKSVATVTFTGTHLVVEHALLSDDGTPAGTMMDRSLLDPGDNVITDDEIEYTYQLTVNPET